MALKEETTSAVIIRSESTSQASLWSAALSKLSEEEQQALDFQNEDKLKVLSDLRQVTAEAHEQCVSKRWKFSRPGRKGETIILRDLFSKTVRWVDMFIQVGDVAVCCSVRHRLSSCL